MLSPGRCLGQGEVDFSKYNSRKVGDFDLKQERLRKHLLEVCDEQERSSREKGL